MTLQRFEHQGAAPTVGLAASIGTADLTFTLTSGTGYPTGASSRLFILVLDPGTPQEEKVLCSSRSGTTITVNSGGLGGRGYDGTIAAAHSVGTNNVQHVFGAIEADDDNDHIYTTTRDDHTQYSRTDGSRAVSGTQSFVNATHSGTLAVTGATTLTGAVTAGSTLAVTGAVTASSTVTASGTVQGTVFAATLAGNGRYVGSTNGAPLSGTFLAGDFANDPTNQTFWLCTVGGTPGTWVEAGGQTDTSWTAVSSFSNSWTNASGPVGFIQRAGVIYLRGALGGPGTANTTAFTLPAGYRPSISMAWVVPQSVSPAGLNVVQVLTSGAVQPVSSAGARMDGIIFPTT